MRFLITGGAGFVGSHLCDELLGRGHQVHVIDELSTGSIENIRHLKDRPGFDYTLESAANRRIVAELVDEVDAIYDMAAAVGVQLIVDSPVRTIENNLHSTEVVLRQASRKMKPVFIASTSEVYGKSTRLPFEEDGDLWLGPTVAGRWSYACGKALNEFLALAYWKERKLPVVVGRLFNTVGPRQVGRYGMVIPKLVQQALSGEPLTVYGDGSQRRCFCHVGDTVRALADLMARDDVHGEVFNIGSNEEISILDLAARVRAAANADSEIHVIPYDEAYEPGFEDMARRIPDIRKIARVLDWRPTRDLDRIIAEVIEAQRGATSDDGRRFSATLTRA
jgi:UDP-glucose 4-epimerase